MYDLDDTEDEDAIDITPDFMKHDDPEVDATDGRRGRRRRADAGRPTTGDDKDVGVARC